MIISQKMERPVQEELLELPDHRVTLIIGLPSRGVERDHDRAEQPTSGRQEVPVGEGQDIGRPVVTEVSRG